MPAVVLLLRLLVDLEAAAAAAAARRAAAGPVAAPELRSWKEAVEEVEHASSSTMLSKCKNIDHNNAEAQELSLTPEDSGVLGNTANLVGRELVRPILESEISFCPHSVAPAETTRFDFTSK